MRYYELIEGEYYDPTTDKAAAAADEEYSRKQLIELVNRDCKPYLEHIDNDIMRYQMYRGLEKFGKNVFKKTARLDDRKPAATGQEKHDRINDYFEREFDHPYRNGVFASGDTSMAGTYGMVHVIFPIGNFEFLWSDSVNDMAYDIKWGSVGGFQNVPPSQEVVDNVMSTAGYTTGHLQDAILSGNEIMLWCKEYYAVRRSIFQDWDL